MTLDGTRIDACEQHAGRRLAHVNVVGSSKKAKHLAYAAVADAILEAALRRVEDDSVRQKAEEILDVMRAADAQGDDPVLGLRRSITMLVAKIEQVNKLWLLGKIGEDDHARGLVLLTEQLRKLHKTRHDIVGSATDENDAAVASALKELELDGDGVYRYDDDAPADGVDDEDERTEDA